MAELYAELDNLVNDAKDWKCKLLFNQEEEGAKGVDIVDLCEFLPSISVRGRKENKDYPPGTNYMFPERFKGLAGKELLLVELKLAAIQCGYSLSIRNSKAETNAKSDRAFHCSLSCLHGKIYRENSSHQKNKTKTKYRTSTKRPTDKRFLCPFKIKLFLQKESADRWPGRWFLSGETGNCCRHCFHFQHEPGHMHVPIQLMTAEEKKLAKECSQLYFTASSSANLLSIRSKTGLNWKAKQLYHLSRKERDAVKGLSEDASTAEKHGTQQGKPPIMGGKVGPVSAEDEDEDEDDIAGQGGNDSADSSDSSTHGAMNISTSMSRAAQNILGQNVLATQQSQVHDVRVLTQSSEHRYQVLIGMVQSFVKLLEDVDDADVHYQTLVDVLAKLTMDLVAKKRRAVAGKAAASMDVDESTHC
jgi:hypothetical protein